MNEVFFVGSTTDQDSGLSCDSGTAGTYVLWDETIAVGDENMMVIDLATEGTQGCAIFVFGNSAAGKEDTIAITKRGNTFIDGEDSALICYWVGENTTDAGFL